MSVNEKMTAIADAIRAKTGGSALLTLDEMAEAITAFAAANGIAYDTGEFIVDKDSVGFEDTVPHGLGEIPFVTLVWTDYFEDKGLNADNVNTEFTTGTNLGYLSIHGLTSLPQRLTSAIGLEDQVYIGFTLAANEYRFQSFAPTSLAYIPSITAETIPIHRMGSSSYWRSGITYKYFVSKAWW